MSSAVALDLTIQGATVVYEMAADVKCRGFDHDGQPCAKVIAKRLAGSVSIKCSRCGHVETYRSGGRDNAEDTET